MSSDDAPHVGPGLAGDGLRGDVFALLLEEQRGMTPTEIGEHLDVTRQSVQYHLSSLTEQGLVVGDDGEYFPQPIFIDPEFSDRLGELLADLTPEAESKIFIDPESDVPGEKILMNCLRVAITIDLLPDSE